MLMADTMAIFLVILGLMLALPALWLLCFGLWPNAVKGAAEVCESGIVKSFALGAPVTGAVVFLAVALTNGLGNIGKISAAIVVCVYLLQSSIGVSGFAACIGRRINSPADDERYWRATLRGGIVLELASLLPILGWFFILPVSMIIGSGASALSLLSLQNVRTIKQKPGATTEPVGASR